MRKKFSWIIYTVTIIFMLLLQTSFFPQFALLRIKPDIVLLFVLSIGLLKGYREGVIAGAVAGVAAGLISWNIWGFYILCYCLAGFAGGVILEKLEPDNFLVPLFSGACTSAAFALIFLLIGPIFQVYYLQGADIYRSLLFAVVNSAFSIPVFLISKYMLVSPGARMDLKSLGIKSDYVIE
jgi:rod shape-determining protein MreD